MKYVSVEAIETLHRARGCERPAARKGNASIEWVN
jgi:hypothetical protein